MWNFVLGDNADWALSPKTKFHTQKYDGLENIEKCSHTLEVILGSSTDTNLGRDDNYICSDILIIFNIVFSIIVTRATQNIGQNWNLIRSSDK